MHSVTHYVAEREKKSQTLFASPTNRISKRVSTTWVWACIRMKIYWLTVGQGNVSFTRQQEQFKEKGPAKEGIISFSFFLSCSASLFLCYERIDLPWQQRCSQNTHTHTLSLFFRILHELWVFSFSLWWDTVTQILHLHFFLFLNHIFMQSCCEWMILYQQV